MIEVNIFPNPATTKFTITSNESINKIEIYNSQGALVNSVQGNGLTSMTLNTSKLPNGIYTCKIFGNKEQNTVKLMIIR